MRVQVALFTSLSWHLAMLYNTPAQSISSTSMTLNTQDLHDRFEPRPDTQQLTGDDDRRNVSANVDYEPHPEKSLKVSEEHQQIIQHITNLYCGSSSETDMQVYAEKAIYDDPYSYCDTRYKIAGKQLP